MLDVLWKSLFGNEKEFFLERERKGGIVVDLFTRVGLYKEQLALALFKAAAELFTRLE